MAEQETSYALSDLVKRRRAELRLSLRTLEERCVDPDTGEQVLKRGVIDRLEKRESVTPFQYRELRVLAIALELNLRDVQDAAGAQFLGITTHSAGPEGKIRVLVNRANVLSPEDLARLVAIAETFPATHRQADDDSGE